MPSFLWSSALAPLLPQELGSEWRETHISLVALTREQAFKFKKPIKFPFVDYSTFQLRWQAACAEVRLNRRLTAGVYLGVRTVRYNGERFEWCSELIADPQEHSCPALAESDNVAVVMWRLDQERFLSHLLARGEDVSTHDLDQLAHKLAAFHRLHTLSGESADRACVQLASNALDNFRDVRAGALPHRFGAEYAALLDRSERYAREFLDRNQALLSSRARTGRIVDGHGDLRLEHICLEPRGIQIYDCVEFSAPIRIADVAAEIGFVCMDLEYCGRDDLAQALERAYSHYRADPELGAVLPFFKQYRAMVRAKVEGLRAMQLPADSSDQAHEFRTVQRYLSLAARYASGAPTQMLILVCGVTGTGKSNLARGLALNLYCAHFNSDVVRKELLSSSEDTRRLGFGSGIYSSQSSELTYAELLKRARSELSHGRSVILDASFMRREHRAAALELARDSGIRIALIECVLNYNENIKRLASRVAAGRSVSDGRPEILNEQLKRWEKISPEEMERYLRLEMSGSKSENLDSALTWLRQIA